MDLPASSHSRTVSSHLLCFMWRPAMLSRSASASTHWIVALGKYTCSLLQFILPAYKAGQSSCLQSPLKREGLTIFNLSISIRYSADYCTKHQPKQICVIKISYKYKLPFRIGPKLSSTGTQKTPINTKRCTLIFKYSFFDLKVSFLKSLIRVTDHLQYTLVHNPSDESNLFYCIKFQESNGLTFSCDIRRMHLFCEHFKVMRNLLIHLILIIEGKGSLEIVSAKVSLRNISQLTCHISD